MQTFKCGQKPLKLRDKARENSYNTYYVAIDNAIERRGFLFYVFFLLVLTINLTIFVLLNT